ncbi:MAG: hypothetical protein E7602_07795 [Ruminococcaceae bacterium]|nr:hypothetical protein [Oscillospiraceae bacterium]
MEILIEKQLLTIFNAFFLGIFSGVIYQFFKALEFPLIKSYSSNFVLKNKDKTFKNFKNPLTKKDKKRIQNKIFQVMLDVLYFIALTPIFAIFFYEMNNGIIRWYVFVFSFIGFLIFEKTIGKIIKKTLEYIGFYIEILFSFIINKFEKLLKHMFKRKPRVKRVKKENKKQVLVSFGK